MTDEEMAEAYATKECCTNCANDFCKGKCECWTYAKNGFLAGLKAFFIHGENKRSWK